MTPEEQEKISKAVIAIERHVADVHGQICSINDAIMAENPILALHRLRWVRTEWTKTEQLIWEAQELLDAVL